MHLAQLSGRDVLSQLFEQAAGTDRAELRAVAGEHELGVALRGQLAVGHVLADFSFDLIDRQGLGIADADQQSEDRCVERVLPLGRREVTLPVHGKVLPFRVGLCRSAGPFVCLINRVCRGARAGP